MKKILICCLFVSFGIVSSVSAETTPIAPDSGPLTIQVERLKETVTQLQLKKTNTNHLITLSPDEKSPLFSSDISIPPVSKNDHIIGSLNAKIVVVEYSDYECPACKIHHDTMSEMMSSYASGTVAQVYRHFPVYKKTPAVALAAECVASIAGNEAFWEFNDLYFSSAKFHDKTNIKKLVPKIVAKLKIDKKTFAACTHQKTLSTKVKADKSDAIRNAATGAPWLVFIHNNEIVGTIDGTYLPEDMKLYIDELLVAAK